MTDRVFSLLPSTTPQTKIYRILPFERLASIYRDKQLALISPEKWEDPFETYWLRNIFPKSEKRIEEKRRVFGICLSQESRSDALWRIYSPTQMGVRIRINAQELLRQLEDALELTPANVYLGKVEYLSDAKLVRKARALQGEVKQRPSGLRSRAIAQAWMHKRTAFKHEHEVRVIAVFPNDPNKEDYLNISIDPKRLIETITLDPRCGEGTVEAIRSHAIKSFGIASKNVKQSVLYKLPSKLQ